MDKQITKEDIDYNNEYFWHYYFSCFRGYDDKKEINIDEVLELAEINNSDFEKWCTEFFQEEEGDENPRYISGKLSDGMSFAIEFQKHEICFFLNDIYIGNLGGHFEAWFLTLDELLAFDKRDYLFLLLLPMTGIERKQILLAESLISKRLKPIEIYAKHSDYIASCIVNGLTMEDEFYESPEAGITCNENHSVRNVVKYPRYREDVIELNKSLKSFEKLSRT